MKEIELIIKAEGSRVRAIAFYEVLGEFGDKIPLEVREKIRKNAEAGMVLYNRTRQKAKEKI